MSLGQGICSISERINSTNEYASGIVEETLKPWESVPILGAESPLQKERL